MGVSATQSHCRFVLQSTLEVQASSPRRATPGFFPDNNPDVNGVEAELTAADTPPKGGVT